jgi:hypothetical protein
MYVWQVLGKELTAATGFTSLLLFSCLRFPLIIWPDMINMFLRARISYQRICDFLSAKDVGGLDVHSPLDHMDHSPSTSNDTAGVAFSFVNMSLLWSPSLPQQVKESANSSHLCKRPRPRASSGGASW